MSPQSSNFLPTGLDMETVLAVIQLIHRAPDSYVPLCRKETDGTFAGLCSLTTAELATNASTLAPHLIQNAYFGINGTYRAARGKSAVTDLPSTLRGEKYLRYLNACYVDLDFGRDDAITVNDAMAHVTDLISEGVLPQTSLCASSGRGAYLFWLLHDEDNTGIPPKSWPETISLYKQINRALAAHLWALLPDKNAFDAARVLRVPGTRHSLCGQTASYFHARTAEGRSITYSLRELAEWAGIVARVSVQHPHASPTSQQDSTEIEWHDEDEAERSFDEPLARQEAPPELGREKEVYGRRTRNPGSAPKRVNGARAVNLYRSQDMLALERKRGGWVKGTRRRHLWMYAELLRNAGQERTLVYSAVQEMAKRCHPPFPSDRNDGTVKAIIQEVFTTPYKRCSRERSVAMLDVSSEEARELKLRIILPDDVYLEQQETGRPITAQQKIQQRLDFIASYIEEHGMISVRAMHEVLQTRGCKGSVSQVAKDMKHLFPISSQRVQAGRPRSTQLPLNFEGED